MKLETLKERISKAQEKIAKKRNTIVKKQKMIAKKYVELTTACEKDRFIIQCDIDWLNDDLKRLEQEIKETMKTIDNYQKQLDGEIKRQSTLITEVPELLKKLQNELVTCWDKFDFNRRERMKQDAREMEYHEFLKKYRGQDTKFRYKTDKEIHDSNVKDAESIILNLINRVKRITGEITNWSGITVQPGNDGWSVLNGYVVGKEGRCEVESVGAGGYNIQRYHIRVLVKPIN